MRLENSEIIIFRIFSLVLKTSSLFSSRMSSVSTNGISYEDTLRIALIYVLSFLFIWILKQAIEPSKFPSLPSLSQSSLTYLCFSKATCFELKNSKDLVSSFMRDRSVDSSFNNVGRSSPCCFCTSTHRHSSSFSSLKLYATLAYKESALILCSHLI